MKEKQACPVKEELSASEKDGFFEIDYEFEAAFDEWGDFPLQCAALLFDLLKFNRNIVIRNQYSIKAEKANVLCKYIKNDKNRLYEDPASPEANYCLWIKEPFSTNRELMDIFRLQGTYLSYIVPSNSFDLKEFLEKWKKDEKYLLLSGQASFICNVVDMDRVLNINFNTAVFPKEDIRRILCEWEKAIRHIAEPSQGKRTETQMRSNHGTKYSVRLCFNN